MKNILTKLHAIMADVSYIQKDKKNAHQGYTYASEKAIKEQIHEQLVKHGVIFSISTMNPRVENGVTWIDCSYRFLDVESGEELTGTFLGSGSARDEKGHYAAVTGAIKYILTSNLLIPTGDDAENDEPPTPPTARPTPKKPVAQRTFTAVKPSTPEEKKEIARLAEVKLGAKAGDGADILAKLNDKFGMGLASSNDINHIKADTIIKTLGAMEDAPPFDV